MNPEHVKILRQGVAAWNRWREKHRDLTPDLSGVQFNEADQIDLKGANFRGADLFGSSFTRINLLEIDFAEADLRKSWLLGANLSRSSLRAAGLARAELSFAMFSGVDLSLADLTGAMCIGTNFVGANLSGACLQHTNFNEAFLMGADFTEAILLGTVFGNSRLGGAKGLERCFYQGPSVVDLRTIVASGFVPERFLRGCGVPDEAIKMVMQLSSRIRFYSAFIAYGEPDVEFAKRLHLELTAKGVSCWIFAIDSIPGKRTWQEIGEKRRAADKMIILCSGASLVRDGALKEIEEQIDEDPDKLIPVSLDDLWKEPGFRVLRGNRELKPFLIERNYADFAKSYDEALRRLLKALERGG